MRSRHGPTLLEIEGLEPGEDGAAYGCLDGRRVRVDFAIPGEQVEVRLTEDATGQLVGEITSIARPSPQRVTPRCPFFGPCGGCTWQHIAYPEQLHLKQRIVQELLNGAIGTAAPRVRPVLTGKGCEWGFRNKVHFVLARRAGTRGGLVLGHYRRRSQSVVEVDQCPVHPEEGNRIAFEIRDALAAARVDGATADGRRGIVRHVVVRAADARPGDDAVETLATLVVTRNDNRLKQAVATLLGGSRPPTGLALNVNDRPGPLLFGEQTRHLHGRRRIREIVAGVSFLISPTAFFQTNVRAAEAMVEYVLEQARDARIAVDLYAGAGLFALPLASRGLRVVAVEENPSAVDDGEASRAFNRIGEASCRFLRARVERLARSAATASPPNRNRIPAAPDLVVLDPPRAGCPPGVLDWICRSLRPRRIVYVSCNPQALAADLRTPVASGYRVDAAQPVDMFPHTAHIETIAVLSR